MARFLVTGGTGNWNSTTNWSASSGGASGASFPTVSDDVIFDVNSHNANITVNVASAALSFSAVSYTGTYTQTSTLSVSGNIVLASGMTIAGASTLIVAATASLTSNGKVWSPALTFSVSSTKTLVDNWVVSGLFTSLTLTQTLAGSGTLTCNGGITMTAAMTGPNTVILGGGTWAGAGAISTPLIINGTSTIGNVSFGSVSNPTLTYSSGTITTAGGTLTIASQATLNTSGIIWSNVSPASSGGIVTLLSDLNGTGTLSSGVATSTQFNGAFNVNWSGGTVTIGTNWSGTATLVLNGSTTIGGGILINNMTWSSGTITQTAFTYRTNTWTINSGVTINSSGILLFNTTPTLTNNATGITFNEIDCGASTVTFNGTNGFSIGTLKYVGGSTAGVSFKSNNTYIITNIFSTTTATAAVPWVLSASTGGVQAIVTLNQGATQNIGFINPTDIDSSKGQTIWDFRGTLSNATNWKNLSNPPTVSTISSD